MLSRVPEWNRGLGVGYELRLAHASPLSWDTVLFAEARERPARRRRRALTRATRSARSTRR